MVQPIDYATLAGGFQSPQQAFMNVLQVRQSVVKQEKEAEEARRMKQDLEDYKSAPTPQKLANLQINYPSLKSGLDAYTQTLSDADKRTTTDFATQAFGLNRYGKPEDVVNLFDTYIAGAEKRPDMMRVLKDAKATYLKIEDPKAREALIGSVLAGTGKEGLELYEKIYGKDENLSPVGKEYQDRVRIQGKDAADAWLKLEGEKLVAVQEGGAVYTGSDILGNGPITGRTAPKGVTFKPITEGGQTEKPSGNFR